jgi:hypothetical protein
MLQRAARTKRLRCFISGYELRIASDVEQDDLFVEVHFGKQTIAEAVKKDGQVIIEWFPVRKKSQFHLHCDLLNALKIIEKEAPKL